MMITQTGAKVEQLQPMSQAFLGTFLQGIPRHLFLAPVQKGSRSGSWLVACPPVVPL